MMGKENGAVLVVGADSDIGSALVRRLRGTVIAHYFVSEEKVLALRDEGRRILPVFGDLSSESGVRLLISAAEETGEDITRIVHLPASPAAASRLPGFDAAQFHREINIQVVSAACILGAFLPRMAKRGFGRVAAVLTSYCLGVPPKYLSGYVAAKYALMGLLKSAAAEYAGRGVTVNAVAPSMTETKFLSTLPGFEIEANARANPMGRNATPEDIAPALMFLLQSETDFLTGAVIPVTGGSVF